MDPADSAPSCRRGILPFAFGFAGQAAQVVLAREFLAVFYGNELSIAIVFGLWLLWVAAGSAIGSRLGRDPGKALLAAAFLFLLALPAAIFAIRDLRSWFDVPAGQYLPIGGLVLAAGTILAPPCLLLGAAFAWVVRGAAAPGRPYAMEAGGAAFGAVAAALAGPALGSFALAAGAAAGLSAAFLLDGRRPAWAGLAASIALAAFSGRLDRAASERYWRHLGPGARLLESYESPDGPVAVVERGGDFSIYRSGRLAATLPDRGEDDPLACAVLLQSPEPRRVFSAGASPWFLREALRHGAERVEAVEGDARLFDLVRRYDPGSLDHTRLVLRAGDARRLLAEDAHYDVILVAAGEPDTAQGNRFYTVEFLLLASRRLAPGGVLAVGPVTAPSAQSPEELLRRNSILFRTASGVFPHVRPTPGASAWLLMSKDAPLTLDESELSARAVKRRRSGVNLGAVAEKFYVEKADFEFRAGRAYDPLKDEEPLPAPVGPNLDSLPRGTFESLRVWSWHAGDAVGRAAAAAEAVPLWLAVLLLAAPAAFRRRGAAMFHAGFAGMAVSLGILVTFQSVVGHLYESLGLLVGAFMAGSAAGSWRTVPARAALAALALACAGMALPDPGGLWLSTLMILGGLASGACYAALADGSSAARLYALDVASGGLAAFVAVPLLLPLHGTAALALLAGLPCLLTAILLRPAR
jgi:spermidine synthase